MSLILLQHVTVRYDQQPVLRDVSFRLAAGERVGLIGRNGTGKTTLLRVILGQTPPEHGVVTITPGVRAGYFSQFSELTGDRTVRESLGEVFAPLRALEAEVRAAEGALATLDQRPEVERAALLDRHAALSAEFERLGGWTYENEIDTVLSRLGFTDELGHRPADRLSGGWRNRAGLARLLLERPDVLLLDEPTNFLDIEGVTWLEGWLAGHRGAAVVVSHDRHFLDRVATRVVEVEHHHLQEYAGNYTQYVRQKPMRLKSLERVFEHEQELLALESEAIAGRQADARDPSNALRRRLATVKKQAEPRPVDAILTRLYDRLRVPTRLLRAEGVAKAYGAHPLFEDVSFELARGDRLAVVGPNGCGKSTLLNVVAGAAEPDAGRVVWERGVTGVDFNRLLEELPLDDSVTHAVNVLPMVKEAPRRQVDRFLSLLGFSDAALHQRIGALSGGLRARVALAQALLSGAAVLLLDEPTNHLDVATIRVIERALVHFPGAVAVVSHDRFFIDQVATRLLVFEEGAGVRLVEGTWTTWQAARQRPHAPADQQRGPGPREGRR
jgi:ATPase subunit of ABC transporter with duplicated ATPase domains